MSNTDAFNNICHVEQPGRFALLEELQGVVVVVTGTLLVSSSADRSYCLASFEEDPTIFRA